MRTRKFGILLLALSLGGVATLPVSAQDTLDDRPDVTTRTADDDGMDLGWLGLIGLAGLLGLRRRDDTRSHVTGTGR